MTKHGFLMSSLLLLLGRSAATTATADSIDTQLVLEHHKRHLSTYADGGTDMACWYDKQFVTCKDYYGGFELIMGNKWDQYAVWGNYTVTEGDTLTFNVTIANLGDDGAIIKPGKKLVEHANFHACRVNTGFCTPMVGKTPGLVTHAPASSSDTGNGEYSISTMTAGEWNLIEHYRMWVPCDRFEQPGCNDANDAIRADFAKGIRVTVLEKIATSCASGYRLTDGKCFACPAGTFEYRRQACIPVDSLHYMPTNTSVKSDQLACPPHARALTARLENDQLSMSSAEGATALEQCECDVGYYLPEGALITTTTGCDPCPPGAICHGAYFQPIAMVGYGKVSNNDSAFIKCKSGCEGGSLSFTATSPTTFVYSTTVFSCDHRSEQFSALCSVCDVDAGYGRQHGEKCGACSLPASFYRIIALVMIVAWFPTQRIIITKYMKSMYTTTSYLQYLGFYAMLNVPWPANLHTLFKGFSFFNLNLEAIHLTCGGVSYIEIWMMQIFLPFIYPLLVSVKIVFDVVFAAAKPKWLMRLGWRPHRDFSFKALKAQYLPPALFYINMYWYTGLSRSIEMLQCKSVDFDSDDADQYLLVDPATKCWSGVHNSYAAIAAVGVFVYFVVLPMLFIYTLLVHVPKHGLENKAMLTNYGFLYRRFEAKLWWWELIEISRKLSFVGIVTFGANMENINQSAMALAAVLTVLLLELYYHPFRSALYDVLEEFTTLTEFAVILLGILVIATAGDASAEFDWVPSTAYILIGMSLCLAIYAVVVDWFALMRAPANRTLRTKHGLYMSSSIFNLEIHSHVLPSYVAQADEASIQRLRDVESYLIGWSLRMRRPADREELAQWEVLSASEPTLIKSVMSPEYRARVSRSDETNLASSYINSLLELKRKKNLSGTASVYLLSEVGRGLLLSWLSSGEALPEAIQTVSTFFDDLYDYDLARLESFKSTLRGRITMASFSTNYDKHVQITEKKINKMLAREKVPDGKGGLMSAIKATHKKEHLLQRRGTFIFPGPTAASSYGSTVGPKTSTHKPTVALVSDERHGGQGNNYGVINALLAELKDKLQCDAVLIVSKRSDDYPKLSASGATTNVQAEDWDAFARTPLSLAFELMQPVNVSNILMEQRFDLSKMNKASVSQLCVPIASNVALSAINKCETNSNKVTTFAASDMLIMRGYGKIVMQKLNDDPEAKKAFALVEKMDDSCSAPTNDT